MSIKRWDAKPQTDVTGATVTVVAARKKRATAPGARHKGRTLPNHIARANTARARRR